MKVSEMTEENRQTLERYTNDYYRVRQLCQQLRANGIEPEPPRPWVKLEDVEVRS